MDTGAPGTLDGYLNPAWAGNPRTGTRGRESPWLSFAELELSSGKLLIGDASYIPNPENCLVLELSPGTYNVVAKVLDYGLDKRISRLRVVLQDQLGAVCGEEIGSTWADTARIGMCDFDRLAPLQPLADEQRWIETIGKTLDEADTHGIASFSGEVIPFVSAGFGDGEFPVYALTDQGRRVGAEVQFIAPDEPYPF